MVKIYCLIGDGCRQRPRENNETCSKCESYSEDLKTLFKHRMMSKIFPLVLFQESFNLRLSGVKKGSVRCDQGAGLHQLYQLPFNNLLHQLLQYT